MEPTNYSVINSNGVCINHIFWDGQTEWNPPEGCIVIPSYYTIGEKTNIVFSSSISSAFPAEEIIVTTVDHGSDYEIEATITHPVPDPYTIESDIASYQERISNNNKILLTLNETLKTLEEDTEEYTQIKDQIESIETDIVFCEEHISSLQLT